MCVCVYVCVCVCMCVCELLVRTLVFQCTNARKAIRDPFLCFGCSMSFSQKESAMTLIIRVLYHKDNVSLDENQPVANDVIE